MKIMCFLILTLPILVCLSLLFLGLFIVWIGIGWDTVAVFIGIADILGAAAVAIISLIMFEGIHEETM